MIQATYLPFLFPNILPFFPVCFSPQNTPLQLFFPSGHLSLTRHQQLFPGCFNFPDPLQLLRAWARDASHHTALPCSWVSPATRAGGTCQGNSLLLTFPMFGSWRHSHHRRSLQEPCVHPVQLQADYSFCKEITWALVCLALWPTAGAHCVPSSQLCVSPRKSTSDG